MKDIKNVDANGILVVDLPPEKQKKYRGLLINIILSWFISLRQLVQLQNSDNIQPI